MTALRAIDRPVADRRWRLFAVVGLVLLSRLPWIGVDYGSDPDSYRVVTAAQEIAVTGRYVESRLPGYPFHELVVSVLVGGGPFAINGYSALMCAVAALFLNLILDSLGFQRSFEASMAFAMTPAVYIASISSMDYVPALAFLLGATYFVLTGGPLRGGVLLGLAIGSRITSGAMLLPLVVFLICTSDRGRRARPPLVLSATALAVGGICFLPVWLRHGFSFLSFTEPTAYPPLLTVLLRGSTGVWGTVGVAAWILVALALIRSPRSVTTLAPRARQVLLLILGGFFIYVAAYARLPLESGYLIPTVPFAIVALRLSVPDQLFRAFCIALCLSSIVDIGRSGISLGGQLGADRAARVGDSNRAEAVTKQVARLGEKVVVVCGSTQPRLLALVGERQMDDRPYLYLINEPRIVLDYLAAGYQVKYLPEGQSETQARYGISLRTLGAEELVP